MKKISKKLEEAKTYQQLAFAAFQRGDMDEAGELSMLALGAASKHARHNAGRTVEAIMPNEIGDGGGANPGDNLMSNPPGIQNEFPEMQDVPDSDQSGDPVRKPLASIEARISNVVAYLAKAGLPVSLDSNKKGFIMSIGYDEMDHDDHQGEHEGNAMNDSEDDPHGKSETWSALSGQKAVLNANAVLAQSKGDTKTARKFRQAAKLLK